MLIAFTGRKGSGKDTAAKVFMNSGFVLVKMADPLKNMIASLMDDQGADDELIWRSIEGDLKEVPSNYLGGRTPRHAMQTLGTEWGRDLIGEDFWVSCFRNTVQMYPHVVVSDVRFPNEARIIKELGGELYRVVRPGLIGANDNHPSETMIDELEVFGEIVNDATSSGDFQKQIAALFDPRKTKVH